MRGVAWCERRGLLKSRGTTMKKVLFASTALVAASLAPAAFAEISVGISAEIGLTNNEGFSGEYADTPLVHTDFDITWTASGTTDNGLTFGATGDWDEANEDTLPEVFISGSFGTFTAGDTDGAYDRAMIEIAGGGLADEASNENGHSGFDGNEDNDDQILRYDIALGMATLSASFENDDNSNDDNDYIYGLGARLALGVATVGIGYQNDTDAETEVVGISAEGTFGPVTATAAYEDSDVTGDTTGISAVVDLGAVSVGVQYETNDGYDDDVYGVWADAPLGGGATFTAAFGQNSDGEAAYGFGVGMSF
ncbi:MAG: porin [Rubricella sp.]